MPHNPATLAPDAVRLPSSSLGSAIRLVLDHANNCLEVEDESGGSFPLVKLPGLESPTLWISPNQYGWKKVGSNMEGYAGGYKIVEFSSSHFAIYDTSGVKQIHINTSNGNIYTKGQIFVDAIDFP